MKRYKLFALITIAALAISTMGGCKLTSTTTAAEAEITTENKSANESARTIVSFEDETKSSGEEPSKTTESSAAKETARSAKETTKAAESAPAKEDTKTAESAAAKETTKAAESAAAKETTKAAEPAPAKETTEAAKSSPAEETTEAAESAAAKETTRAAESAAAAHSHTWNSGEVTTAATCKSTGIKTYTCTVCGASKTETIAATGQHTWKAATYTAPKTCTVCGATEGSAIQADETTNNYFVVNMNGGTIYGDAEHTYAAFEGSASYTVNELNASRSVSEFLNLSQLSQEYIVGPTGQSIKGFRAQVGCVIAPGEGTSGALLDGDSLWSFFTVEEFLNYTFENVYPHMNGDKYFVFFTAIWE